MKLSRSDNHYTMDKMNKTNINEKDKQKENHLMINDGLILSYSMLKNSHLAQNLKFPIKDFFSKYDQVHSFLRIWSSILKNP